MCWTQTVSPTLGTTSEAEGRVTVRPTAAIVPMAVTGGGGVEVADVAAESCGRRGRSRHGAAERRRRRDGGRAARGEWRQLVIAGGTGTRHAVQHLGQVSGTLQDRLLTQHNMPLSYSVFDKKLSYRRVTARCVLSVVILPITTQQCRNYLYD